MSYSLQQTIKYYVIDPAIRNPVELEGTRRRCDGKAMIAGIAIFPLACLWKVVCLARNTKSLNPIEILWPGPRFGKQKFVSVRERWAMESSKRFNEA
jgi:hypothetical protein